MDHQKPHLRSGVIGSHGSPSIQGAFEISIVLFLGFTEVPHSYSAMIPVLAWWNFNTSHFGSANMILRGSSKHPQWQIIKLGPMTLDYFLDYERVLNQKTGIAHTCSHGTILKDTPQIRGYWTLKVLWLFKTPCLWGGCREVIIQSSFMSNHPERTPAWRGA